MTIGTKAAKYAAIGTIQLKNQFIYIADFLMRTIFLLIILYIFLQLWTTTFSEEGSAWIEGYRIDQIMWYLIVAEAIAMAFPSLATKIEDEVKNGEIGYKLLRPVGYIGYHYVTYMGEVYLRFMVNLLIGGLLGLLVFGWPDFGWGWFGLLLIVHGAFTINFWLNITVALCAFWVEETRGIEFVYHKLLFTVGGMLLPLEIFPEWLQRICAWLPFQTIMYFPAKLTVRFDPAMLANMLLIQLAWAAVLGAGVVFMFRLGVKKLHVNGG